MSLMMRTAFTADNSRLGCDLHRDDQREVLARFIHRYTGDHRPMWANEVRPNGQPYLLHFRDDQDWLAHTRFMIRKDGRLDRRFPDCHSTPTYPNGQ